MRARSALAETPLEAPSTSRLPSEDRRRGPWSGGWVGLLGRGRSCVLRRSAAICTASSWARAASRTRVSNDSSPGSGGRGAPQEIFLVPERIVRRSADALAASPNAVQSLARRCPFSAARCGLRSPWNRRRPRRTEDGSGRRLTSPFLRRLRGTLLLFAPPPLAECVWITFSPRRADVEPRRERWPSVRRAGPIELPQPSTLSATRSGDDVEDEPLVFARFVRGEDSILAEEPDQVRDP